MAEHQHLLQTGETATRNTENVACRFTDMSRRKYVEAPELSPEQSAAEKRTAVAQQYVDAYRGEQQANAEKRAQKIKSGKMVINKDGSWTEKF